MTVSKRGDKWRLYTADPAALLPQLVDYARSRQLQIVSLNTLAPSLEEAFLAITGQEVGTVRHKAREEAGRQQKGGRR